MHARPAGTLIELAIVLTIMATLLAIAVPPVTAARDRSATHAAQRDAASLFTLARDEALARHTVVWVVLDSAAGAVHVRVSGGGTRTRSLGSLYGVTLRRTRDSMSYDGRGLGRGAANLTVIVTRGRALDSLVISRMGRVRR